MRITNHKILPYVERDELAFSFDGVQYKALKGDTIASALLANGIRTLRYSEKQKMPRGIYCGIGHCYECRVNLQGNGVIRACIAEVEDGMTVEKVGDEE